MIISPRRVPLYTPAENVSGHWVDTDLKGSFRKPLASEGVRLNRSHPLNRGLAAQWLFNEGSGLPVGINGERASLITCGFDRGMLNAPTPGVGCTIPFPKKIYTAISWVIRYQITNWDMYGSVCGTSEGSGSSDIVAYYNYGHGGFSIHGAGWNETTIFYWNSGGILTNTPQIAVFTWDMNINGGYAIMYLDGKSHGNSVASQTVVCNRTNSSANDSMKLFNFYSEYSVTGWVDFLLRYDRWLSPSEALEISRHPFGTPNNPRLLKAL